MELVFCGSHSGEIYFLDKGSGEKNTSLKSVFILWSSQAVLCVEVSFTDDMGGFWSLEIQQILLLMLLDKVVWGEWDGAFVPVFFQFLPICTLFYILAWSHLPVVPQYTVFWTMRGQAIILQIESRVETKNQ